MDQLTIYRTKRTDQIYYKHPDGVWWCYAQVDEEKGRWEWWYARLDDQLEHWLQSGVLRQLSRLEFLLFTGVPFEPQEWMSDNVHILRARNRFSEPINHFYVIVNGRCWDWKSGRWILRHPPISLPVRRSDPAEFEAILGVKFQLPNPSII